MDQPAAKSPRQLVAVAVIAVVVAVSLVLASTGGDSGSPARPSAARSSIVPSSDDGTRSAQAIALLSEQEHAIAHSARAAFVRTWDQRGSAQSRAGTVFGNLAALRVESLDARYVGANSAGLDSEELRLLGGNAWTADVDIAWRLLGVDRADAWTTLTYTFAARQDTVYVADMQAASGERTPVWLLGPLDVRRSDRTLVASTDPAQAERLDTALRQAVVDVQRVLPDWRGDLVSYGPSTQEEFDTLIAASPGAYGGIAAVTTTADGSRETRAPVAIVVNPTVFDGLGPIGGHVVISHEATHVATGATIVTMPLWVAEGFADYVGVGSVDVPLNVSAHAAIRDVRAFGLPDRLPADAAFQDGNRVEATYEEAWLAMRVIARDYGQAGLVAFYEDVLHRPDEVKAALRTNLETTQEALTRAWRRYLGKIVDGS